MARSKQRKYIMKDGKLRAAIICRGGKTTLKILLPFGTKFEPPVCHVPAGPKTKAMKTYLVSNVSQKAPNARNEELVDGDTVIEIDMTAHFCKCMYCRARK